MTCYQTCSLNIFSHVWSANRCFEGVIHSICFVNKKLERECLSVFALCLLRKEGRQASKEICSDFPERWTNHDQEKWTISITSLVPLSPSFTLDSTWMHKKPGFYWSKSQMSLCSYAKILQVYQNLKSIQSLYWSVGAGHYQFDLKHIGK